MFSFKYRRITETGVEILTAGKRREDLFGNS